MCEKVIMIAKKAINSKTNKTKYVSINKRAQVALIIKTYFLLDK